MGSVQGRIEGLLLVKLLDEPTLKEALVRDDSTNQTLEPKSQRFPASDSLHTHYQLGSGQIVVLGACRDSLLITFMLIG